MKFTDRVRAGIEGFTKAENAVGDDIKLGRQFLKYGDRKALVQDWSKVVMDDKEMYSGYPYAAINNRANKVAQLAESNLKTDATKQAILAAKSKGEEIVHPYLTIIDESLSFDNDSFWYDISTYLDLEGVYYLLAVRNVGANTDGSTRVGNIQEFKLLNPYDVRRIRNKDTLEIGGYVESRMGLIREIPPQMIIEIRKLNPFSEDDPFAMTDAAKTAQFTIKQGGDYTRHSLKNNMAAPGIISTDVLLDPQQFQNFVSRVTNQEKGLPLFGNGAGAITWDSMQIDMDKAGLKDINEINRSELFAVSGVGKTMMAIEESGTTRETAKVQKDLFIENHVMPQLKLILSALNQDYKKYYHEAYLKDRYRLYIDNPLGTDREAELKDIEIRDESYKLYDKLVAQGYKRDLAAKYSQGEITLEELGEPTEEPRPNPIIEAAMLKAGQDPKNPQVAPPAEDGKGKKEKKPPKKADKTEESHDHNHDFESIIQQFETETKGILNNQQAALQNAIVNIEGRVTNSVINKVTKNAFDDESDIINKTDKRESEKELILALAAFYTVIIPLFARQTASKRTAEFGYPAEFKMTPQVKAYIKQISQKAGESHINTILEDLRQATKQTYDGLVQAEVDKIAKTGRKVTDADLVLARKKALEGANQQQIINAIKQEYGSISTNRAKAIARTETNRAFTRSQYEADLQFLVDNDLMPRAYKTWETRSSNPCPICVDLAAQGPIPFTENFADLGDELVATYVDEKGRTRVKKQVVDFEEIHAGNAHVNCSCIYKLVIKN